MSSSEIIRGVTGQYLKSTGSKVVDSILNRTFSRELGQSLRADTINTANSSFFPPTTTTVRARPTQQRISLANIPRAQSVPIASTSNTTTTKLAPEIPSIILPNVADLDPTRDDQQLWERSRQGVQLTAEQAAFLATPALIPSLPFVISTAGYLERNIWATGPQSVPAGRLLKTGSDGEVYEIEAENFEAYLHGKCWLYNRRIEEMESCDEFSPVVDLPEEFVELTVNEIFEVCYERCLARGRAEAELARQQQQTQEEQKDDDAKSEHSAASSAGCSEDLPFISSVNVVSIRRREVRRARAARAARDAELGIVREPVVRPAEKTCSPVVDTTDAGDISFASAGSDPERANEPPLFTIRSKKEPIKIVDPKTLQRPDKPKSPKDLAKDVAFLKRGLRIMEKGVELAREAYSMFKAVGMDNVVLNQTTDWMGSLQEFVRNYTAILNKADSAKQAELRNTLFESEGQMMLQKKKMDNAILGWTNFAISMFPVRDFSTARKRSPTNGLNDENADELDSESPKMKTKHLHNNVCASLTHELQKLTEDNRLKFKTLLSMLIESLGEAKVWLISAPSYAKVRPVKYTEIKPSEAVTAMKVAPPAEKAVEKRSAEKVAEAARQEADKRRNKGENEKPAETTATTAAQTGNGKTSSDETTPVEPQYHGQGWYNQHYGSRGYAQAREYIEQGGGHRPRSAVSQMASQMGPDAHNVYNQHHQQGGYDTMKRAQDGPRGRQMTRSSGHSHSRQQSAAGSVRHGYVSANANAACTNGPQMYPGYATHAGSPIAGEFAFGNDNGGYADFRYPYGQQPQSHPHSHSQGHIQGYPQAHGPQAAHAHVQPVLQHPQPWRATTSRSDGHDARAGVSPEQSTRGGERGSQQQHPQRSMTVTPQMLQHAMLQGPSGAMQVAGPGQGQEMYAQVPVSMPGYQPQPMYSVYGHGWGPGVQVPTQSHHHYAMHAQQMQRQKGMMYPYGHHPGFR
ncbi:hypothetical protein TWF696_003240 [Orbilia brochopaga]|uniref:Uncharacterized protein n=1 Tax=Orbilia brochopaga TaxID=3140254 RepID=A0AAV9TY73_9PEZI